MPEEKNMNDQIPEDEETGEMAEKTDSTEETAEKEGLEPVMPEGGKNAGEEDSGSGENEGSLIDAPPKVERRARQIQSRAAEDQTRLLADEQSAIANESALRSAIRTGHVFTGEIASVEEIQMGGESIIAAIVVLQKVFKVMIPFQELFSENPIDMSTVDLNSADGRYRYMRRTRQFAERMIGGTVPFCITHAERDGRSFVMLGSRARAMKMQSRICFGGDHPRYRVGDTVEATLTAVNVHSVVALVGGVDVVIPQHRLTRRWFLDLHDGYRVGDIVRALITEVSENADGVFTVRLNPVRVELADAKERYHIISVNGRTKGIITNIVPRRGTDGEVKGMMIFAYLPGFDLFAMIVRVDANSFGRRMMPGTQVIVRVIDYSETGYLICEAMYDHGNNSMFNAYTMR